jgi:hypothetical protein
MDSVVHSEGCDGYTTLHYGRIESIHPNMYKASCDHCAWVSPTVGTDARASIAAMADQHIEIGDCTGQCKGA